MEGLYSCSSSTKFISLLIISFVLLICFAGAPKANAGLQSFDQATKGDGSLSFLVIGDWGRRGRYNQTAVAVQMGRIGEELDIDFVVSTGDNFYDNGLTSDLDPAFEESFSNVYTANSLQKQWYSVLGNHDYRGDAEAQLSPTLRKIDSRWLCLRSFIVNAGLVDFFFVDTTPFVESYFSDEDEHIYDWRAVKSQKDYTSNLLKDVESALRKSTATWKIVVGHHAIRSISHHGDTIELVEQLLPMLRENNVDFYMNGHDHCLEHIRDNISPIQFLTSGAGSKAWRGDVTKIVDKGEVSFFYDGQGFMSVELNPTEARIVFYDVFGHALHQIHSSRELHSSF